MATELVWKPIPGYSLYEASNIGQIRRIADNKVLNAYECKTTVGSYLNVSVKRDGGNQISYSTHRLICMAFHGTPEGYETLDVNHKDDNKHNNNDWNLEWLTRSQNVKYAFQTGANKYALASRMTDLETGMVYEFISMKEVAEFFQLKHKKGFHIAANHTVKPYLNRYLFEITGEYHNQNRTNAFEVYCVDFINGRFYRFENLVQLQLKTGLNKGSIQTVLKAKALRLFNGHLVCRVTDKERLFEYVSTLTQSDIDQSVADYENNVSKDRRSNDHGWLVKNYLTGEIIEIASTKEVASLVGLKTITSSVDKTETQLYKGYAFKRKDSSKEFLDYTVDYINLSLETDVTRGKPVVVKDLILNTTKVWPSIGRFAKSIEFPRADQVSRSVIEQRLVNRYSFEDLITLNTNGFLVSEMILDKTPLIAGTSH